MQKTNGNVHIYRDSSTKINEWTWDDKVVGGFYPPMSTTSWQAGATPALEDEDFQLWNKTAINAGGTIIWGTALTIASLANKTPTLVANDWAIAQIKGGDTYLKTVSTTGTPLWARANTVLAEATSGITYSQTLINGTDFWSPSATAINSMSLVAAPSWLKITKNPSVPGNWIVSGTPTETALTMYQFEIKATDANGLSGSRQVTLIVNKGEQTLGNPNTALSNNKNSVRIYQNPTTDQITISLGKSIIEEGNISIQIYDLTGKIVAKKSNLPNASFSLSLLDLGIKSNAVYIVKINTSETNYYHKIILQ